MGHQNRDTMLSKIACGAVIVASADALKIPSMPTGRSNIKAVATSRSSEFAYGLPGVTASFGEFDPLNLLEGKSKGEVYKWREAELAHGRVALIPSHRFRRPSGHSFLSSSAWQKPSEHRLAGTT